MNPKPTNELRFACVLIVDDHPADVYLHRLVLEEAGCADVIDTAADGLLALEYLREARAGRKPLPNLIFLDINMPLCDGWEFLERANEEKLLTKDVNVITMLTGNAQSAQEAPSERRTLVSDFVSKPLTAEKLTSLLAKYTPR